MKNKMPNSELLNKLKQTFLLMTDFVKENNQDIVFDERILMLAIFKTLKIKSAFAEITNYTVTKFFNNKKKFDDNKFLTNTIMNYKLLYIQQFLNINITEYPDEQASIVYTKDILDKLPDNQKDVLVDILQEEQITELVKKYNTSNKYMHILIQLTIDNTYNLIKYNITPVSYQEKKLRESKSRNIKHKGRKIICLTTNKIYNSIVDAAEKENTHKSTINYQLKKSNSSKWQYI